MMIQTLSHAEKEKILVILSLSSLANRLRYLRRYRNLTQKVLATRAGAKQSAIQKTESGKSHKPRRIKEIAEVLEVPTVLLQFGLSEHEEAVAYMRRLKN